MSMSYALREPRTNSVVHAERVSEQNRARSAARNRLGSLLRSLASPRQARTRRSAAPGPQYNAQ